MKTLPNENSALEWNPKPSNKKKSPLGGNLSLTSGKTETPQSASSANKTEQESFQSSSLPEKSSQSGSGHIETGPLPENLFSGMMWLTLGASTSFLGALMAREGSVICFPLSAIASLFWMRWWTVLGGETFDVEDGQ